MCAICLGLFALAAVFTYYSYFMFFTLYECCTDWRAFFLFYVVVPQSFAHCRRLAWIKARAAISCANSHSMKHRPRHCAGPSFRPGDRVWLSTKHLKLRTKSSKLTGWGSLRSPV